MYGLTCFSGLDRSVVLYESLLLAAFATAYARWIVGTHRNRQGSDAAQVEESLCLLHTVFSQLSVTSEAFSIALSTPLAYLETLCAADRGAACGYRSGLLRLMPLTKSLHGRGASSAQNHRVGGSTRANPYYRTAVKWGSKRHHL